MPTYGMTDPFDPFTEIDHEPKANDLPYRHSRRCLRAGRVQPDAKVAQATPKAGLPQTGASSPPLADAEGAIKMDHAVTTIKRLGGLVEMNLREGDLVVTGVRLSGSQATDSDLESLQAFPQLESLRLKNTAITDAGLAHLSSFARLRQVSLGGTKVSDKGVEALRRALPKLIVDREQSPAFDIANNWGDHPELQKAVPWETATKTETHVVFQAKVDGTNWAIRMNDFPALRRRTVI